MLNFFKKSQPIPEAKPMAKEYPEVVAKIHNEFMTTGERLLKEAKDIIYNYEIKDAEKVERLKKIGFSKSRQVRDTEKAVRQKEDAEARAKIVEYYSVKYPMYKFITEDAVTAICKKYSLVMGEIRLYKGFVPEKNLLDIEKFSVKDEDCLELRNRSMSELDWYTQQMLGLAGSRNRNFNSFSSLLAIDPFERDLSRQQDYRQLLQGRPIYTPQPEPPKSEISYLREFKICAPIKDMDTDGHELKGHKLVVHVPDPVVLHPVKNGYLIVTAWGDEASDELVVNEINN